MVKLENIRLDPDNLQAYNKQDTANKAVNIKYVKIIHPYHPLRGKSYPVVRMTRQANQVRGSWVIDLGNGKRMCLPFGCGEVVDAGSDVGEPPMGDNDLWTTLPHLQALRQLVGQLKTAAQGVSHDPLRRESTERTGSSSKVGTDPQIRTTQDDPDPERDDLATGGAGAER